MNILIIGNGFDLAHGLPTRYTDFLNFCRDTDKSPFTATAYPYRDEFLTIVKDNIWLKYFIQITPDLDSDKTWIDFENEIANIVTYFESKGEFIFYPFVEKRKFFYKILLYLRDNNNITFGADEPVRFYKLITNKFKDGHEFIEFIYSELRAFSRAFEIYCMYVNNLKVEKRIGNKIFDCVLSFNYTNTFSSLYINSETKYCYIHGKAQYDGYKSNIIFGIDDSLPIEKASSEFAWVKFKKYHQRIFYKTGSEYKDWLKGDKNEITVHISGHSLDKTDHDVLKEFFDKECPIIIYYYNEADFLDKIQKVITIIEKEELIKRVHGSSPLIKFIYQHEPIKGIFGKEKLVEPFRKRQS